MRMLSYCTVLEPEQSQSCEQIASIFKDPVILNVIHNAKLSDALSALKMNGTTSSLILVSTQVAQSEKSPLSIILLCA